MRVYNPKYFTPPLNGLAKTVSAVESSWILCAKKKAALVKQERLPNFVCVD
jgi:hypothetical protein